MSSDAAELCKLAENGYFAVKLSYFQEIATICDLYGIDYEDIREALADDPRIGRDHVVAMGGWGGSHCLRKDVPGLAANSLGRSTMSEAAIKANEEYELYVAGKVF